MATAAPPEPPRESALEAGGPQLGVIEDARRRQRRRRAGITLALAAMAVAGGLIVLGVDRGGSHRAGEQLRAPGAAATSGLQQSDLRGIRLLPALEQGMVGWCFDLPLIGGGCPALPTRQTPIFSVMWNGTSQTGWYAAVVTTSRVAAIKVNNTQVQTHYTGLPYGFRVALLQTPATPSHYAAGPPPMPPTLTALDATGHPIVRIDPQQPLGGDSLPTTFWQRPGHAPSGPCRITARMRGLSPQWGHVATRVQAFSSIVGRAFESCADTEYYLHNWPLKAAVLLDASHPGTPPAPIPNMTPIAENRDMFSITGLSSTQIDHMTARRLPGAWLVVAGGNGPAQRLAVLRHLRAQLTHH